jgi:hypothetical protein
VPSQHSHALGVKKNELVALPREKDLVRHDMEIGKVEGQLLGVFDDVPTAGGCQLRRRRGLKGEVIKAITFKNERPRARMRPQTAQQEQGAMEKGARRRAYKGGGVFCKGRLELQGGLNIAIMCVSL